MAEGKRDQNFKVSLIAYDPVADTTKAITSESLSSAEALHVAIVDGDGSQITSFGGGTQYTEADTDTTITGTAALAEASSNTLMPLQLNSSNHLLVDIASNSLGLPEAYTEAATDASITGVAVLVEGPSEALTPLLVDASQHLQVDIAASSVTVGVSMATLPDTSGSDLSLQTSYLSDTSEYLSSISNAFPAEDGQHSSGALGAFVLAVRNDTLAALATTDGDYAPFQVDASGAIYATIASVTPDLMLGTDFSNVFGTSSLIGEAGSAASEVLTIQGIASMTPILVDATGQGDVPVTLGGESVTVDLGSNNDITASGSVADSGTSPQNPVMTGGQAISTDGTDPGSVTEADVAIFKTDLNRRLLVNTHHPRFGHKHLDGSTAYTDESIVADPGDGFQVIITSIIFSTGAATACNFFLEESTTKIFGPIYLEAVAGRGFSSGPIWLPVTASTAVTLTTSASIAQSFDCDYIIQAV